MSHAIVIDRSTRGDGTTLRLCDAFRARRAARAAAAPADGARRDLVLRLVQPALAGLLDGSVSTLAPIYAVAMSSHDDARTFAVGMATSIGAGVSMGFAEAMSDDGSVSGRGSPVARGLACGLATAAGGVGHTLPFLLHDFRTAVAASLAASTAELLAIAWIKSRFMDATMGRAMTQVVLCGGIVLGIGALIGSG